MSRELKFRAWDKITKQIFEVKQIDFAAIERNVYGFITYKSILGGMNESLSFRSFDNIELMQYTGLKDRKGVEIYEGDIVERSIFDLKKGDYTRKSEVHFLEGAFCIYTEDWFSEPLSDDIAKECKVIGNIHENSELLK